MPFIAFEAFTGELRIAEREERKSLVAMCRVSHLSEMIVYLSAQLDIEIEQQPAHVTMYTREKNLGIGLNSPAELAEKSRAIAVPAELVQII